MNDFYSYTQEEDDEDIISYSFLTVKGSLYQVYFDPYQYIKHVGNYPKLLASGYGFGFNRSHKAEGAWDKDPLIGQTIAKIVFDFIKDYGDDVVLLYHCDYVDNKQKGRDKIFHSWYESSNIKEDIIKIKIVVGLTNEQGGEVDYYVGYLTSRKNKDSSKVEDEFRTFAETLASNK